MDDIESEIQELQASLLEIKKEVIDATEIANGNSEAEKEVAKREAEVAAQLKVIQGAKAELARERNERSKAIRVARTKEEEFNRKLQRLIKDKEAREELKKHGDSLDLLTIGKPWREWAYDHQISGGKHLASAKRAILGDKRGLGKSLTSLIFLDMNQSKKVIIFTPKDVSLNFASEIHRWSPDRPVIVLTAAPKEYRDSILAAVPVMLECTIIINYEAWRKDPSLVERLVECKFDTVIIDEAHKIKNTNSKDYQGIYRIVNEPNCCPICGSSAFDNDLKRGRYCTTCLFESNEYGAFCSVKSVVPMTGTVVINKPQEIWGQLNLIDPQNFGNKNQFLRDYCRNSGDGRWHYQYGGEERLLRRLGMKYIGRTPESAGVTMPPQTPQHHYIEFDPLAYPQQWQLMRQIKEYGAIRMSDDVAMGVPGILGEIMRMSQALVWPGGIKMYGRDAEDKIDYNNLLFTSDVHESIKIDKAMELILLAIEEGDRVVLFSRFKEALIELQRRLSELEISNVRYDGSISDKKAREAQLDFDIKTAPNHAPGEECNDKCPGRSNENVDSKTLAFNAEYNLDGCNGYKYQVFLGQYQKAGTGINLTGARQMVILDRYFASAYEDQASGRIQRLDSVQDTVVHVITITSPAAWSFKKTIDQWMDELIAEKKKMTEGFDNTHLEQSLTNEFIKAMRDGDLI